MYAYHLINWLISSLLLVFSLNNALANDKSIVIGQAIDLSGPNGSIGRDYVAGITTFFDYLNSTGGINGRRVTYLARDDCGETDLSVKLVADLLEKDRADYLLGGFGNESTAAILASPAFQQSGQILFAPLASPPADKSNRAIYWRPSQEQEIDHIFSWFEKLGIRRLGLAYNENDVDQKLLQHVKQLSIKHNVMLVGSAKIHKNHKVTAFEAQRLAYAAPNIVVSLSDSIGTALFLREFRKHAERTFVAGTSMINLPTLNQIAGQNATEWTVFSQVVPNPGLMASVLQQEHITMMRKYRDEEASSMTLEGFAVAKSLLKAINLSRQGSLQPFLAHRGSIDLGGLQIVPSNKGLAMSSFVDIALLRRGRSLMF